MCKMKQRFRELMSIMHSFSYIYCIIYHYTRHNKRNSSLLKPVTLLYTNVKCCKVLNKAHLGIQMNIKQYYIKKYNKYIYIYRYIQVFSLEMGRT